MLFLSVAILRQPRRAQEPQEQRVRRVEARLQSLQLRLRCQQLLRLLQALHPVEPQRRRQRLQAQLQRLLLGHRHRLQARHQQLKQRRKRQRRSALAAGSLGGRLSAAANIEATQNGVNLKTSAVTCAPTQSLAGCVLGVRHQNDWECEPRTRLTHGTPMVTGTGSPEQLLQVLQSISLPPQQLSATSRAVVTYEKPQATLSRWSLRLQKTGASAELSSVALQWPSRSCKQPTGSSASARQPVQVGQPSSVAENASDGTPASLGTGTSLSVLSVTAALYRRASSCLKRDLQQRYPGVHLVSGSCDDKLPGRRGRGRRLRRGSCQWQWSSHDRIVWDWG